MTNSIRSAIVIGAGVVGVATAYALARRGINVTIVDARSDAGSGTSYANGGQLSYLYTGPLANHRIRSELPGLALGMNPAFRIKANPDPDFLLWLLSFLRNCTQDRYIRNSRLNLEITLESQLAMLNLLQMQALDFDYQVRGRLQLLYTPKAIRAIEENFALKGLSQVDQQVLSLSEAERIEPAVAAAAEKPLAALYTPSEAVGDARKFARALLNVLVGQYGVTTLMETRVKAVHLASDHASATLGNGDALSADLAVLCTGADRKLLKSLHLGLPVFPMKGYSITAPKGPHAPEMSLTDSKRRLVFTPLGDRMRIAGMADLGWTNESIDPKRLQVLLDAAKTALPEAADLSRSHDHWAGLRPQTPDSLPRLGRPHPALAYNLGHGMLGWTMAMGTGERIGKMVD